MLRIAVASSDAKTINEHFGHATFFRIYDVTGSGEITYIETRDCVAACQHIHSHSQTDFDRVINLISDCGAVLVSKIGDGAAGYVISKGIRTFEAAGEIEAVLAELAADGIVGE